MWLAKNGLIAARWSDQILSEWVENLLVNRPDLQRDRLQRTCSEMNRAIPDALIPVTEAAIKSFVLPDPQDRHVLALAVQTEAEVILTFNLRDFPVRQLPEPIRAISPDEFLTALFGSRPRLFWETMQEHRQMLTNPCKTSEEYFATLRQHGLVQLIQKTEQYRGEAESELV
jgi:predicted nucleic acid-binding protein